MSQQTYHLPPPVTAGISSAGMISPFSFPPAIAVQNLQAQNRTPSAQAPNEKEKKKIAWKYEGYQEFSRWMASDDDFFVIRRFQSLNAEVILYMQDRIVQIEERLQEIHKGVETSSDELARNSSFRWGMKHEPERGRLMCELTGLLNHYNQYVETFSKIRQRPAAEKRQIENLKVFFERGAITKAETKFAEREDDLISINSNPSTPLGRIFRSSRRIRFSRLVQAKSDPGSQSSAYTHYTSDTALARLSTFTIMVLGLAMLLGPMWWLECVSSSKKRLLIITVFLAMFMILMSLAITHKPFEVVGASAAYAAVLVVFMQIDGKN